MATAMLIKFSSLATDNYGADMIAHSDNSTLEYLRSEASSVNKSVDDFFLSQLLQVFTRFTQCDSTCYYLSQPKSPVDKMVEWNAAGNYVSSAFDKTQFDRLFTLQSFDGLELD